MAENPGFSSNGRETRRETDCLLEGNGFELPVPRETQQISGFGRFIYVPEIVCILR
jgi:hypothetical protein